MATTGRKLTIPFIVGTSQIVGQGPSPELWCLYSTSDVGVSPPVWSDATADVRSFSTSRGRSTELGEVEAGTATVTLGNRTRTYDPTVNTQVRPLNRWWFREQFSGETQDLFKGYAESYQQQWPAPGGWSDATCAVSCTDELKLLSLAALPVTSPARDSYANVVLADDPTGYWDMGQNDYEYAQQEVQDVPPDSIPPPASEDAPSDGSGPAVGSSTTDAWLGWFHGGI